MVVSYLNAFFNCFVEIINESMSIGFHVQTDPAFHHLIVFDNERNIFLIRQIKSLHRISLIVFLFVYDPTNEFPINYKKTYQ